jgi:hypothetical protein
MFIPGLTNAKVRHQLLTTIQLFREPYAAVFHALESSLGENHNWRVETLQ